jgi:hypothetical protein
VVLDRAPDDDGLRSYESLLRQTGDLGVIARNLSRSDEAWEKSLVSRPENLAALLLRGLLGRDPNPAELEAIARQLTGTGELESALNEFTNSEGFRSARGLTEARKIPDEIYQIATGDAATPDLDFSPKNVHELRAAINTVLEQTFRSDRIHERMVRIHADKFVRAIGQGITGSEPDAKTLDAQTTELRASGDLRLLARDLSRSDEAWEKSLVSRPENLAALLLRGLLGRDPNPVELEATARQLTGTDELESALNEFTNSEGFRSARGLTEARRIPGEIYQIATGDAATPDLDFSPKNAHELRAAIEAVLGETFRSDRIHERMVRIHADKFVKAIGQGITGSEPDAATLDAQTTELRATGDLANLIHAATLTRDSCRAETLPSVDGMIDCVYRGLLKRPADEDGLRTYRAFFEKPPVLDALFAVIKSVGASREAITIQINKGSSNLTDRPAWVFLHAEKTGGTSVQNMLRAAINPDVLYAEHADNLHLYPRQALAAYDVLAGHFNYDSLRFIPRNIINVTTILRDPHDRLVSLYTMWRAHTREAQSSSEYTEEAGRLGALEFFTEARSLPTRFLWNHMTWCVMGNWRWRQYQQLLAIDDPKIRWSRIQEIRLEISSQVRHFAFIGILEHFPETCARLFKMMGLKYEGPRHDHTLQELVDRDSKQFRYVAPPKRTAELDLALSRLTELDQILYSEAKGRFENSDHEV